MKKIISIILISATILIIGINLLILPKQAKAFWGIGDITIDIVNQVKDWIVDALPKSVARSLMIRLQQEVARWAQGGFSDENKPFAMTSWKKEIQEALNIASGRFVQEFNLTPLCAPIRVSLDTMFNLGLGALGGRVPYSEYAACTIGNIIDNVEEFWENPSIQVYGWDTWTALMQPQNNIFGSAIMALQRQEEIQEEETLEKEKEIEAGQGYKSEAICTEDDEAACKARCSEVGPPSPACLKSCEKSSIGVCLKKQTTKLGSEIKTSLDKTIGSDMDWLITADEITEMLNLVFSGLFTKLIHGTGLSIKPTYSSSIDKSQLQHSYYKSFKKTQTPEDLKKLKTDIVNNIIDNIKRLTTSAYECDNDYQLKGDVYSDVANEILDQESQHLYTAIEGVDLKPDFIVLDSSQAVKNKIAIYGTTWRDIPFNRYPDNCQKLANRKCKDIASGLPYNLELENINSECTTGCLGRINDYRTQEPPLSDSDAVVKAVNDKKCSTIAIGNACIQGAHLIGATKNRCDECMSAQETCESKTDPIQKKSCIESHCNNYQGISTSITSPSDFYNKCSILQTKDSCYVCLKEYFMPAYYCGEVYDYINRGFVKYPALVYDDMWWGRRIIFSPDGKDCTAKGFNFWGAFWGWRGLLAGNYDLFVSLLKNKLPIPTGLTCRVMPDFIFPDTNGKGCKDFCTVTEEELKNIGDDKPGDLDCTGPVDSKEVGWGGVWGSDGYHPGGQWLDYLIRKKSKCCAALLGHDPVKYKACRGIEEGAVAETEGFCESHGWMAGTDEHPECFCEENERFIGETATSWNPFFACPIGQKCEVGSKAGTCRKGCANFEFEVPDMVNAKNLRISTNPAPGGSVITISKNGCGDTDQESCVNGGNCDYVGELPNGVICQTEAYNSRNSTHCCTDGEHGIWQLGATILDCDVSAYKGQIVNLSVVSNQASDCKTTASICITCNPNDPGYPNYGYQTDQCNNKIPPAQ